jgi:hypothetical protein
MSNSTIIAYYLRTATTGTILRTENRLRGTEWETYYLSPFLAEIDDGGVAIEVFMIRSCLSDCLAQIFHFNLFHFLKLLTYIALSSNH